MSPRSVARGLAYAQVAIGVAMVAAPRLVAGLSRGPVPPAIIVRVLGGRQIGQRLLTATRADASTLTLGAAVDVTHLASMIALAVARPRWRRTASASGAVAAVSAVAGLALARNVAASAHT